MVRIWLRCAGDCVGRLLRCGSCGLGLLAAKPQVNMATGAMVTTSVLGVLYALVYLASRRGLAPVIVGHTIMDMLIEPWLVMTTLAAATTHLR